MNTRDSGVNFDAAWLRELAADAAEQEVVALSPEDIARLHLIASHLDSMDEKLGQFYSEGVLDAQARLLSRSNVVDSRQVSERDGQLIVGAMPTARKIEQGRRALRPDGSRLDAPVRVIAVPRVLPKAKKGFSVNDL